MTTLMHRYLAVIATASLFFCFSSASAVQEITPLPLVTPCEAGFCPERLDLVHNRLQSKVDASLFSGYVSLILRNGKTVDWRAYGYQDVESNTPMRRDSIVRIYSMSKIVTSVAVLILLEQGDIRLDDTIERYLPELADRVVLTGGTADAPEWVPAERPITIEDLLTHTAGYYYDAEWSADPIPAELMRRQDLWAATSMDDFIQRVAALPLNEQPGTRFRYGINTDLLGVIVERCSGETLESFLSTRIFDPLGMPDTSFDVADEKLERRAAVHHRSENGLQVNEAMDWRDLGNTSFRSGGGGLYSTAFDYGRFAQMLLNGGELEGVRILSPKTVQLMTTDRLGYLADPHPFGISSQGFGLGVSVLTQPGRSPRLGSAGIFGWDGAASTNVQIDPAEETIAILLLQHVPFNEDDVFSYWTNGYSAAIVRSNLDGK